MKKSERFTSVTQKKHQYYFKLYVAGDEQNSQLARENLQLICDKYLKDGYQIEEVNVLTDRVEKRKEEYLARKPSM